MRLSGGDILLAARVIVLCHPLAGCSLVHGVSCRFLLYRWEVFERCWEAQLVPWQGPRGWWGAESRN